MDFNRLNTLSKQAAQLDRILKDLGSGIGRAEVLSISFTKGDGLMLSSFSRIFLDDVNQRVFLALSQELERLKEEIQVTTLDKEEK